VLHVPRTSPPGPAGAPWLQSKGSHPIVFETCQRRIVFYPDRAASEGATGEFYRDVDAYALVLEVVCGLRSKVLGETEVQGQFRRFCREHPELAPWDRWLLEDARHVRSLVLGEPENHSYAGVVRAWCRDRRRVVVLGRGQLAKSVQALVPRASAVASRGLERLPPSDAVVVAAPIEDAVLTRLRTDGDASTLWIDLRGDRSGFQAHWDLDDLYAELARASRVKADLLPTARKEIQRLAQQRFATPWSRPGGWEDLAA
jgi:hypothetical protein